MAKLGKGDRTRAAILRAAQQLFAERGYNGTTIRDVAALASIDAALVVRYFGSKDALFTLAASIDLAIPDLSQIPMDLVGQRLVHHFLSVWEGPAANTGMAILLRSAASNELSSARMRDVFMQQVAPALERISSPGSAGQRAALIASQLLGLAYCRYILKLSPLTEMSLEQIVVQVGPTIQRYALTGL